MREGLTERTVGREVALRVGEMSGRRMEQRLRGGGGGASAGCCAGCRHAEGRGGPPAQHGAQSQALLAPSTGAAGAWLSSPGARGYGVCVQQTQVRGELGAGRVPAHEGGVAGGGSGEKEVEAGEEGALRARGARGGVRAVPLDRSTPRHCSPFQEGRAASVLMRVRSTRRLAPQRGQNSAEGTPHDRPRENSLQQKSKGGPGTGKRGRGRSCLVPFVQVQSAGVGDRECCGEIGLAQKQ